MNAVESDGAGGVLAGSGDGGLRLPRGETAWIPDVPLVRSGMNHGGNDAVTAVRVRASADGFLLSEDGGGTWRTIHAPWATPVRGAPNALAPTAVLRAGRDRRILVAAVGGLWAMAAHERNSLWRSTDDGASWTRVHDLNVNIVAHCCGLAVDSVAPDTLFAVVSGMAVGGGGARVLRSTDAGRTWADLPNGWFSGMFAVAPGTPTALFGQRYEGGLVRSTDAGDHWSPSGRGLPDGIDATQVVGDPARPHVLFAATSGRGIYRSVDSGVSWHPAGRAVADRR